MAIVHEKREKQTKNIKTTAHSVSENATLRTKKEIRIVKNWDALINYWGKV
ncbi:MAG: hypothetical protein J5506_03925 [Prevotella sp.]|nr:hypothetical protein [Prevotella sp.]